MYHCHIPTHLNVQYKFIITVEIYYKFQEYYTVKCVAVKFTDVSEGHTP
jgi:hypothetical protein